MFHINFAKIDEIKGIKPDIMFAENDVYSHLNEKMYLKYPGKMKFLLQKMA